MRKREFLAAIVAVIMAISSFAGLTVSAAGGNASAEKAYSYYMPDQPVEIGPHSVTPEKGDKDIFFDGLDQGSALHYQWFISEDNGGHWQKLRTQEIRILLPCVTDELASRIFRVTVTDQWNRSNTVDIYLKSIFEFLQPVALENNRKRTENMVQSDLPEHAFERLYVFDSKDNRSLSLSINASVNMKVSIFRKTMMNPVTESAVTAGHTFGAFIDLPESGVYYIACSGNFNGGDIGDKLYDISYSLNKDPYNPDPVDKLGSPVDISKPVTVTIPAGEQYAFVPVSLGFYDVLYFDISDSLYTVEERVSRQNSFARFGENGFIAMAKDTYVIPFAADSISSKARTFTVNFHKLSPQFSKAQSLAADYSGNFISLPKAECIYDIAQLKNIYRNYYYSYPYFYAETGASYSEYQQYIQFVLDHLEEQFVAYKISVPAGTVLSYQEQYSKPKDELSSYGNSLYFIADQDGFMFYESAGGPKNFMRNFNKKSSALSGMEAHLRCSLGMNILQYENDLIAPLQVSVPCAEETVLYYMPQPGRSDYNFEGASYAFDYLKIAFKTVPMYDRGQNTALKSEYSVGDEITVSVPDVILSEGVYADDVSYKLYCQSVYAQEEGGAKIVFRDNGNGTYTGKITKSGNYTLQIDLKGNERCYGVDTPAEEDIYGMLLIHNNHCSDIYTVKADSFHAVIKNGDLNGDGSVNGTDSVLLLQYLAGWDTAADLRGADVNGDGIINGTDSVLLLQYLAGWNVTLGKQVK